MSSYKAAAASIAKHIAPILKEAGFKKRGNGFNRTIDNGYVHQFSLALGRYTSINFGQFSFHLGCYIPEAELYRQNCPNGPPKFITDAYCCLRGGLPTFKDGGTAKMHIAPFEAEPQKAEKYVTQALETFSTILGPEDVLSARGRHIGIFWAETPLAILQTCIEIKRQNKQTAADILANYIREAPPNHAAHLEHVRSWANAQGLRV